ncbi:MAG: four helix bundle protein [Candidatus Hydrogenedentota bacterium]|nr:MAG: four helix bundle protein [Candidatus Hydrogenedentota bacterium]
MVKSSDEFDHERLQVYQKAALFAGNADRIAKKLRRRRRDLADQLERASSSILLNIAEGAGEYSRPEKKRFFRMAKRSGAECAGILDLSHRIGCITPKVYSVNRELLLEIIRMLVALCR